MAKYIAYSEICIGLGQLLGPLIGSSVYDTLQFDGTLYLFGGLNLLGLITCIVLIPGQLNKTISTEEVLERMLEKDDFITELLQEREKERDLE